MKAEGALHDNLLQVFEKIPSLLYLYAQGNQLKEIPSGLPATLEQLRLSRNRISKIPPGVFNKMTNLTMLDLYYNQVTPSPKGTIARILPHRSDWV